MDNNQLLERILDKVDILDSHLDGINKTLVRQEEQLAYHILRTDLLEKKLEPVETHVKQVSGGAKLLGLLSVITGIVVAMYSLIKS